jgi:hypothetical protein
VIPGPLERVGKILAEPEPVVEMHQKEQDILRVAGRSDEDRGTSLDESLREFVSARTNSR